MRLSRFLPTLLSTLLLACSSAEDEAVTDDSGAAADSAMSSTDSATGGDTSTTTETPPATASLEGYWVWKEVVEGDKVTSTFTDADMTWKVGPSGWPGCPDGISCTKYGIDVLYVNASRFHHMHRVTTGSDFQDYGSYTVAGDKIMYAQQQAYSCAHPKAASTYPSPATKYARFKRMGADLWVSDFSDKDPSTAKWTVYRPTTKADAHNKYSLYFCGEMREGGKCHCLCPSRDVLADYACITM